MMTIIESNWIASLIRSKVIIHDEHDKYASSNQAKPTAVVVQKASAIQSNPIKSNQIIEECVSIQLCMRCKRGPSTYRAWPPGPWRTDRRRRPTRTTWCRQFQYRREPIQVVLPTNEEALPLCWFDRDHERESPREYMVRDIIARVRERERERERERARTYGAAHMDIPWRQGWQWPIERSNQRNRRPRYTRS